MIRRIIITFSLLAAAASVAADTSELSRDTKSGGQVSIRVDLDCDGADRALCAAFARLDEGRIDSILADCEAEQSADCALLVPFLVDGKQRLRAAAARQGKDEDAGLCFDCEDCQNANCCCSDPSYCDCSLVWYCGYTIIIECGACGWYPCHWQQAPGGGSECYVLCKTCPVQCG